MSASRNVPMPHDEMPSDYRQTTALALRHQFEQTWQTITPYPTQETR
jgi:hypothetical protein